MLARTCSGRTAAPVPVAGSRTLLSVVACVVVAAAVMVGEVSGEVVGDSSPLLDLAIWNPEVWDCGVCWVWV